MRRLLPLLILVGIGVALVGCSGEQTAPKPDPAQFMSKPGGATDTNAAPKTP